MARFKCNLAGWCRITCWLRWYRFCRSWTRRSYFRFRIGWHHCFQSTHSLTAALDQLRVVASTAEIYLLPVWKNKRPPHWNSTFNFDHHLNRQVILHQLAKLHRNRAIRGSVMASYQFSRWQQRRHNITSGFGLGDVALLRRPKSISKSNFVGITQSTAEILLLPI